MANILHCFMSLGLSLVLWLSFENMAYAQPTVALLGLEAVDAPQELAAKLSDALTEQFKDSGEFRLVLNKSLDEVKLVFGCIEENPDCMARAGRSMQVNKLIWGTLKKVPKGYDFTIFLFDVGGRRIERFISRVIGSRELTDQGIRVAVEQMARSFLTTDRGKIKITCNVPGAKIKLGSRIVGIAGENALVIKNVTPGTHEVTVIKKGYSLWSQLVPVERGQTSEVDVFLKEQELTFTPEPPPTNPITEISHPTKVSADNETNTWKVAFWSGAAATLGLGIGAIFVGREVLNLQKDKEQILNKYYKNDPHATATDVCATSGSWPSDEYGLKSICNKGQQRALITNILLATAGGVAVLSGFFYYKAYLSTEHQKTDSETTAVHPARTPTVKLQWNLTPLLEKQGGLLEFGVNF